MSVRVIEYDFWYSNGGNCGGAAPESDIMIVEISDDDGGTWYELDTVGPNRRRSQWRLDQPVLSN